WSPFFLAAHLVLTCLDRLGLQVPRDGFGWAYELPVYCGSFFYGLLGIWYIWRLLRDLWGEKIATSTTYCIVLGTPVAAYLWFEAHMSHVLSMTLIAVLFYYLHQVQRKVISGLGVWLGFGVLTGLIAMVRLPDLIVGLAVAWVGITCVTLVPKIPG